MRAGKAKGKGGALGSSVRRTSTSNRPSPSSPLYMEILEMQPRLPTNRLLMPPLNVAAHDSLFGGLRTPVIGHAVVRLEKRLPPSFFDGELAKDVASTDDTVVEVWENERKFLLGWEPTNGGGTDPPPFSNAKPTFEALDKETMPMPGVPVRARNLTLHCLLKARLLGLTFRGQHPRPDATHRTRASRDPRAGRVGVGDRLEGRPVAAGR